MRDDNFCVIFAERIVYESICWQLWKPFPLTPPSFHICAKTSLFYFFFDDELLQVHSAVIINYAMEYEWKQNDSSWKDKWSRERREEEGKQNFFRYMTYEEKLMMEKQGEKKGASEW